MMITTNEMGVRVLTPSNGMFLTNGETYSQLVYLGKNASYDEWWEVDSVPEEPEELTAEEALAIIVGGEV